MSAPSSPNGGERDRLGEALDKLATRPERDASGKFVPGNLAAARTLERAETFWEAVEPAKVEMVERIRQDLALDGAAAATLESVVDGFAEASLLRRSLFVRLAQAGGAVTARGRTRAAFGAYLAALDRERRLALDLGLERRGRDAESLVEYLERHRREAEEAAS
jgi:hypothetical protein